MSQKIHTPNNIYCPWPTFQNLLKAYKKCQIHKSGINRSQIHFEQKLGKNLVDLHRDLILNRYRPSPSKYFVVTHPKPREIFCAEFRDRVVHHLLVDRLEPIWERKFIYSSFACRPGKGPLKALEWAQIKTREISKGGIRTVWALQMDVENFFVTINRTLLKEIMLAHSKGKALRDLVQMIYTFDAREKAKLVGLEAAFKLILPGKSWFDQGKEQGIPIGNLTSQLGANAYLTQLDHFIQRKLKPQAFLRYMDDLLLLGEDPGKLHSLISPLNHWLAVNRSQSFNPEKTLLTPLTEGISYLGYRLRQEEIPAQPLQIFPEPIKKWRFIRSLRCLEKDFLSMTPSTTTTTTTTMRPHPLAPWIPKKNLLKALNGINSRIGGLIHSRSYLLRLHSLNSSQNKKIIPLTDLWNPLKIKKGYRALLPR